MGPGCEVWGLLWWDFTQLSLFAIRSEESLMSLLSWENVRDDDGWCGVQGGGRLIVLILSFDWVTVLTFGSGPVRPPALSWWYFHEYWDQSHSPNSEEHQENIHCLRLERVCPEWLGLLLYIIASSFIQIRAKHFPGSHKPPCEHLSLHYCITVRAPQLAGFQVQIPVISWCDVTRRPRKLFRIDR